MTTVTIATASSATTGPDARFHVRSVPVADLCLPEDWRDRRESASDFQQRVDATFATERATIAGLPPEELRAHSGKYVTVQGASIIGFADTYDEANRIGYTQLEDTKFLVDYLP